MNRYISLTKENEKYAITLVLIYPTLNEFISSKIIYTINFDDVLEH